MGLSQKSLTQIEKFFLFRVPMNPQKDWKAKLKRAHFFKVRSDRITVCINSLFSVGAPTKKICGNERKKNAYLKKLASQQLKQNFEIRLQIFFLFYCSIRKQYQYRYNQDARIAGILDAGACFASQNTLAYNWGSLRL